MVEVISLEPVKLKALTSLRFFAAISIVWLHSKVHFSWAGVGPNLPFVQGVSFFFVLSGFILMHSYGSRNISYRRFLVNRIARLWPLHFVTLLSVILFMRADSQAFNGPGILAQSYSLVANFFLLQSWVPTLSYAFSWNAVSWSISTELFFYAMFPLLVWLMKIRPIYAILIGMVPLVAIATVSSVFHIPALGGVFDLTITSLLYAFPVSRLFEFTLGMTAYWAWSGWKTRYPQTILSGANIEYTLIVLWVIWFGWVYQPAQVSLASYAVASQWFGQAGSSFLFAFTIVVCAGSTGPLARILSNQTLVTLGEISFAIYMVHQIIMKLFAINAPEMASPLFIFGSILIAGTIGHYLVELPGKRLVVWLAQLDLHRIRAIRSRAADADIDGIASGNRANPTSSALLVTPSDNMVVGAAIAEVERTGGTA